MKTSLIALSMASMGAMAFAQHTLNANRVLTNNQPYFVICTCTNAATGANRQWVGTVHRDYLPSGLAGGTGVGMASDHVGWKIIRDHTYRRCAAGANSTATVTGWTGVLRFSAATPDGGGGANPWMPRVRITGTTALAGGGAAYGASDQMPDFSNTLADFGPGALRTTGATRSFRVTRTCAAGDPEAYTGNGGNPFSLNLNGDVAMTYDYQGGEMDDVSNSPAQSSLSFVGGWQTGSSGGGTAAQSDVQFGWTNENSGSTYTQADVAANQTASIQFNKWLTFVQDEPSIAMWSDWGQRRQTAASSLRGHSLGTYQADLSGTAGSFGASMRTSRFAAGDTFALILDPIPFQSTFCFPLSDPTGTISGTLYFQTIGLTLGAAAVVIGTLNGNNDDDLIGPLPGVGPIGPGIAVGAEINCQAHGFSAANNEWASTEVRTIVIRS